MVGPTIAEDSNRSSGRLALRRPDHKVRIGPPDDVIRHYLLALRLYPVTLPTNLKQISRFPLDDFAHQLRVRDARLPAEAFQALNESRLKRRVKIRIDIDL